MKAEQRIRSFYIGRSVVASTVVSNDLIVFDSTPALYKCTSLGEFLRYTAIKGYKSYIPRYNHLIAISEDKKYFLLSDTDTGNVLCFSLEHMRLIYQTKEIEKPEFCLFSQNSQYFAVANVTNEVYLYTIDPFKNHLQIKLSDSVSALAFSDDETRLCIGTYDKNIIIYHIAKKGIEKRYKLDEIAEVICLDRNLVIYTREGKVLSIKPHLEEKFTIKVFGNFPTIAYHKKDTNILLLGSRANELSIHNHINGEMIAIMPFRHWGITSITFMDEELEEKVFIGFSDGYGVLVNIQDALNEVFIALKSNKFDTLGTLVDETPLLFISKPFCEELKKYYKEIFSYKSTIPEVINGINIIRKYLFANTTKHELLTLLYSSQEIVPFMEFFDKRDIAQACDIADKTPILKQLAEFNIIVSGCLSQILEGIDFLEAGNENKFEKYIELKATACETCIHDFMPNQNEIKEGYAHLKSSVSSRNFSAMHEIIQNIPILKVTRVYRKYFTYVESLVEKMFHLLYCDELTGAEKYVKQLANMGVFSDAGEYLLVQIKNFELFFNACIKNDYVTIFHLLDEYPMLSSRDEAKEQIKQYEFNILKPASLACKKGDITAVKTILAPFENIDKYKKEQFEIIKRALMYEILLYAPINEEKALLDKYYQSFGWDKYYQKGCDLFELKANKSVKEDTEIPQYSELNTFLSGEKIKRDFTQNKEEIDEKDHGFF